MRILRRNEVKRRTGRSDASIWRDEQAGRFPRRVRIGPNAVGWLEEEIESWLRERAAERKAVPRQAQRSESLEALA